MCCYSLLVVPYIELATTEPRSLKPLCIYTFWSRLLLYILLLLLCSWKMKIFNNASYLNVSIWGETETWPDTRKKKSKWCFIWLKQHALIHTYKQWWNGKQHLLYGVCFSWQRRFNWLFHEVHFFPLLIIRNLIAMLVCLNTTIQIILSSWISWNIVTVPTLNELASMKLTAYGLLSIPRLRRFYFMWIKNRAFFHSSNNPRIHCTDLLSISFQWMFFVILFSFFPSVLSLSPIILLLNMPFLRFILESCSFIFLTLFFYWLIII